MRFSDWIDDPRAVTLAVATLISAALWVATWSIMGQMDMGAMGMGSMEMNMEEMDQGMTMGDEAASTGGSGMAMGDQGMASGESGMAMGEQGTATGDSGMAMGGSGMAMGDGAMEMGGMEMSMWGMSMDPTDWSLRTMWEASLMWLLMMAAMMLPAMAPVMAIYTGLAAKEDQGLRLAVRITLFTSGYFVLWAAFSIGMAMVQLGLRGSEFFTMGGTHATPIMAAILMIVAGAYQLSPVKDACLRHCRHPLTYLLSHWREGIRGAFYVGANHGIYCVGCCGVFMGLMFVFGAMNVWWMAVIALYFLAEKIAPEAERWGRWTGYALMVGGAGWAVYQLTQ